MRTLCLNYIGRLFLPIRRGCCNPAPLMRITQRNERRKRGSENPMPVGLTLRIVTVIVLLSFVYQSSGIAAYVEAQDAQGAVERRQDARRSGESTKRGPAAEAGIELQTARDAKKQLREVG